MTGYNTGSKTWARPQLVRVGRIASVQSGTNMGMADGSGMNVSKS